jgi:hypothetical protein
VAGDDMGQKERAWLCAGHRWDYDDDITFPIVMAALGQPAILYIPRAWAGDADRRELAFGWGASEIAEQRCGWLFLVKRLIFFAGEIGRRVSVLIGPLIAARVIC